MKKTSTVPAGRRAFVRYGVLLLDGGGTEKWTSNQSAQQPRRHILWRRAQANNTTSWQAGTQARTEEKPEGISILRRRRRVLQMLDAHRQVRHRHVVRPRRPHQQTQRRQHRRRRQHKPHLSSFLLAHTHQL